MSTIIMTYNVHVENNLTDVTVELVMKSKFISFMDIVSGRMLI